MPFIFPKRFLRTRDILDPREMNDDVRPVQALYDGELDRHNFDHAAMKRDLLADASTAGLASAVSSGAYHTIYSSGVECFYKIDRDARINSASANGIRHPPNFVEPDGVTLRDTYAGTAADGKPFIIPNTGEWSPIKNADLSGPMQSTFTTSRSRVWLCAYMQYIWQGFYEWKQPWIKTTTTIGGVTVRGTSGGWGEQRRRYITEFEAASMNAFGPSSEWKAYPNDYTNVGERTYDVPYAYPLNEPTEKSEREAPNFGGFHHISKGFYPALVQFALRVDGQIIDESITGKKMSFEESSHGLAIDDSQVIDTGSGSFVFGQRSSGRSMDYTDTAKCRPGQKLRTSRAVACGPEVLPVRIGAVVALEPGSHTVEIVARRLQRKRKKFEVGDFVGVFSRRLLCADLPLQATRQEPTEIPLTVLQYQTEDKVTEETFGDARDHLAGRVNAIEAQDIRRGAVSNTMLPSKVAYSSSISIAPTFTIDTNTGQYSGGNTRARFPGFANTTYIDRVVTGNLDGWNGSSFTHATGAGWYQLKDSSNFLSLSSSDLAVVSGQDELIVMADVEILGIDGRLSKLGEHAKNAGAAERDTSEKVTSYLLQDKYLDLFAMFAIGYKVGSTWTIGSKFVPGMVNSFNWANRDSGYIPTNAKGATISDRPRTVSPSGTEYSFTETPGLKRSRRGNHTHPNNLGINIPLMIHVTDTTNISEVGVFASSTYPHYWDPLQDPYSGTATSWRPWKKLDGVPGSSGSDQDVVYQWRSPAFNRGILRGIRIQFGEGRLTAMKLTK